MVPSQTKRVVFLLALAMLLEESSVPGGRPVNLPGAAHSRACVTTSMTPC